MRAAAHDDPHESSRTRALGEPNEFFAAASVINISLREDLPVVIVIGVQVHRIVTGPVFDFVLPGVRRAPMNPNGVHRLLRPRINHHPLWMRIFGLSGEMRIEIRIAFPKRIVIAVGDTRITIVVRLIDGVSTSRQMIAVGDVDRFTQRIVRGPISTLMNRITPRTARIPMPNVTGKLRAQPIRQRPKAS